MHRYTKYFKRGDHIIITYFRSSSYNTHSMCEQQFFAEYVLGWRGPSGQKADKGTICHKVLEILAVLKQGLQDNQQFIEDDILGKLNTHTYSLDSIIEKVYKHYSTANSHHKWSTKDYKDCHTWVYKALTFNNGMFDPRNCEILQPEQHFDITIKKPWAAYSYDMEDNTKLEGYLAIKGTIDLITKIDDNTLEIVDYKTGKRLDWATGEEKTQEKLEKDPQLRIYHYAVSNLYPEIDHVIFTIYFINDGGPFSICFDKSDLPKTEDMLRQKFEIVKNTRKPRLTKSWMCSKLCHFGKTTFDNTSIQPKIEYRENQNCSLGSTMTKCEQIKHDIELNGIDEVTRTYKHHSHVIGKYKAPGSVE